MDSGIKVQKDTLYNTYPALEAELNKLMSFADGLNRNLSTASVKFNSANFKRASEMVVVTQRNLSKSAAELRKLKAYFEKLQGFTEQYSNLKF